MYSSQIHVIKFSQQGVLELYLRRRLSHELFFLKKIGLVKYGRRKCFCSFLKRDVQKSELLDVEK